MTGVWIIVWAILATAVALASILTLVSYRRQIKNVCRHLEFHNENKSNIRITSQVSFSEVNRLIDEINHLIDLSHKIERSASKSEKDLKDTITNLSHDIRTPLTSMDGYFQLMYSSESEEERLHYMKVIQSRITVLKDMLEELFTYAKLQNENYSPAQEELDFSACARNAVFSFYDELTQKGIVPHIILPSEKIPVMANEEALRRVFQNIIKNAVEHGNQSIAFTLIRSGSRAVFTCSNDVEKPEEIDPSMLFNQFYKADTARTHSSTGLGLYISKCLIEKMNGSISATVSGTMFSINIELPVVSI